MLKHIVMWKFKDAEGKSKDENIEIVKNENFVKNKYISLEKC